MADVENITETLLLDISKNDISIKVSTPEGRLIAYGSLFLMAIIPIIIGSLRSVSFLSSQKTNGEIGETLTKKDAALFPIIASVGLCSLYIIFKVLPAEYINLLFTIYFFGVGVLALANLLRELVTYLAQNYLAQNEFINIPYRILFTSGKNDLKQELLNFRFDRIDVLSLILSLVVGVWYSMTKHWIANNIFGLAFSINAIAFVQLNSVSTGCILLSGLFIYDIVWVFGFDVMVFVAKSFEAPIKLVFPQDLLINGLAGDNFGMLGLGDIVLPGIHIALLLRLDVSLDKGSKIYFYSGIFAYCVGLATTMGIMHVFKAAQPALLYLVPTCIGIPLLVATVKGELKEMFKYEDTPNSNKQAEAISNEEQKNK